MKGVQGFWHRRVDECFDQSLDKVAVFEARINNGIRSMAVWMADFSRNKVRSCLLEDVVEM